MCVLLITHTIIMHDSFLQDEGTTPMSSVFPLTVEVTAAIATPPTVNILVHTISAPEADYTATVSKF